MGFGALFHPGRAYRGQGKLVLEPVIKLGEVDPELYYDVYLYYVSYNGENVIKIYTNNEWSEELWNKVRSTLVFF